MHTLGNGYITVTTLYVNLGKKHAHKDVKKINLWSILQASNNAVLIRSKRLQAAKRCVGLIRE